MKRHTSEANVYTTEQVKMAISAIEFLERAADLMLERAQEYDSPEGERSMGRTVAAFNVLTGNILSEQEGWMFMMLLKLARQAQNDEWHQDSSEDAIAYAALMAEAWQNREEDAIEIVFTFSPDDDE
jgi:hypothetical protein